MENFEHKGRKITFSIAKTSRGWVWNYQIDDEPARRGASRAVDELAVRHQVIDTAMQEVESALRS